MCLDWDEIWVVCVMLFCVLLDGGGSGDCAVLFVVELVGKLY